MKHAKLFDGRVLTFSDDVSDIEIKSIVKQLVATKGNEKWDNDHVKTVINEMSEALTETNLDKAKIDHFGPAIEKQTGQLQKANKGLFDSVKSVIKGNEKTNKDLISNSQSFAQGLLKSQNDKLSKLSLDGLEKAIKEVAKQMVSLSHKVELLASKSDKNTAGVMKAIMANTEAVEGLKGAQLDNTSVLKELVEATKAPKTILRDKAGKVQGVKRSD